MTRMRKVSMFFLSTILVILAISFSASGVLAASHGYGLAQSHANVNANVPIIAIQGKPANYHPNVIRMKVNKSFDIKNNEKVTETVTFKGSPFATLPPGTEVGILCNSPNRTVFNLQSNPSAALHIICTA